MVKVDVKHDMRQAGKKYNKSSEKRGKLDVGYVCYKVSAQKVLIIVKIETYEIDIVWSIRHQHIAC
ncbi:hypothetical protein ACVQ90_00285 [Staphylococcus aureus]